MMMRIFEGSVYFHVCMFNALHNLILFDSMSILILIVSDGTINIWMDKMDMQLRSFYKNSHSIASLKNETCSILGSIPKTVNATAMQFPQALTKR